MKVFIATQKGQGKRPNDFFWTTEGELVRFGMECHGEDADGPCGCRRSMVGMVSKKSTTTFTVQDRHMSLHEYAETLDASDKAAGFRFTDEDNYAGAFRLLMVAERFPVGSVLEKRGDYIMERKA